MLIGIKRELSKILLFYKFNKKLLGIFYKFGSEPVGKIALKDIDNMSVNKANKFNIAQTNATTLNIYNQFKTIFTSKTKKKVKNASKRKKK